MAVDFWNDDGESVINEMAELVCIAPFPSATVHITRQYENDRVEQSHEATRVRERGMVKFKSARPAQRFVTTYAAVKNLFNLGRHLVKAEQYRNLRISTFREWSRAVV